jgi:hypothetical protein
MSAQHERVLGEAARSAVADAREATARTLARSYTALSFVPTFNY